MSLIAPFLLFPLPVYQSFFHACVSQAALFPHLSQVYEADSLDSFPLSHCSPHLEIKTRILLKKISSVGAWLPFSCVCVNPE